MSEGSPWLSFVQLTGFFARWEAAGCTDRDLRDFELALLTDPTKWPVVPTAGGWRKARFAPPSWGKGKSGGLRVYYADLSEYGRILLGTAFTKAMTADIGAADKRVLAGLLAVYRRRLEGGE